MPAAVESVQLRQHLVDRLMALLAAQILNYIAEFALERAAARRLHYGVQAAAERIAVPAWCRRAPEIRFAALVLCLPRTLPEIGEERFRDAFQFAPHQNVARAAEPVAGEGRIGTTENHDLPAAPELAADLDHPPLLPDLARDSDIVRIGLEIDRRDLLIAKGHAEIAGRHCGYRGQCQVGQQKSRRKSVSLVHLPPEKRGLIGAGIDQIERLRHAPPP